MFRVNKVKVNDFVVLFSALSVDKEFVQEMKEKRLKVMLEYIRRKVTLPDLFSVIKAKGTMKRHFIDLKKGGGGRQRSRETRHIYQTDENSDIDKSGMKQWVLGHKPSVPVHQRGVRPALHPSN